MSIELTSKALNGILSSTERRRNCEILYGWEKVHYHKYGKLGVLKEHKFLEQKFYNQKQWRNRYR